MTDYTKTTNFAAKDSLPSGNANKIVKGAEIDTEFNNIATASATKANIASPTFTGTVTIPTADINGGAVDGTTIGASSASSIVGTTIVANTSINIAGDGATVTGIKDEDDMSSDSATKLATQQSIKAYVDSQVTAQDLDVTDGSSSIDIDLDSESLGILGGTGIDSTASGTGVTLAIDSTVTTLTGSQTLTNKTLTAPTLTGTTVAASLDISGDVDVDGTLETDALSINGTTVTSTAAELNILDGVTSTTAELNILDGVTSTTAELNILDGVTSTTAELNILDGVTATAAELNIMDGVTATTAELNIMDGVTSTAAELNILDGKAFLDEDDMSSNSATGIASQQSIKAYVDAQITAEDLDFQADSGGALSIDLDSETLTFTGGTGIDTSGSGNAVTFAIDSTVATLTGSQTLTNKSLTAPTLTGTAVVASLDISGDIDVDGTTNLDVVDIDGAVDMASTLAIAGNINSTADIVLTKTGTDDAGIKFATAGANRYLASDENGVVAIGTGTTLMGGTKYLTIDSGNVGIGESDNSGYLAPDLVVVAKAQNGGITVKSSSTSHAGTLAFADATSGTATYDGYIQYEHNNRALTLAAAGSERMRLTSAGALEFKGASTTTNAQAFITNDNSTLTIGSSVSGSVVKDIHFNSPSTMMVIDGSSGYVGLGTSSPQALIDLTVSQAKTSTGGAAFAQLGKTNESSGYAALQCEVKGGASAADRKWTFQTIEQGVANAGNIVLQPDGGKVTIGGTSTTRLFNLDGTADAYMSFNPSSHRKFTIGSDTNGFIVFDDTASQYRMTIDSSGNLLVGKTATTQSTAGTVLYNNGQIYATANNAQVQVLTRTSTDGKIQIFYKDSAEVGSISSRGGEFISVGSGDTNLEFNFGSDQINPSSGTAARDNAIDLGNSNARFTDIFATNGTIQTSDRNEKQDIEALSDAEQRVAVAAKGLLRKFRWKSAVEEKGDDARIHFGIIAQDLQDAFAAEGLDAGRYAMFISSTWTDEETGEERTRMGVRYSELLAFIISAI